MRFIPSFPFSDETECHRCVVLHFFNDINYFFKRPQGAIGMFASQGSPRGVFRDMETVDLIREISRPDQESSGRALAYLSLFRVDHVGPQQYSRASSLRGTRGLATRGAVLDRMKSVDPLLFRLFVFQFTYLVWLSSLLWWSPLSCVRRFLASCTF